MNDFQRHVAALREEIDDAVDRVLRSGWFILGAEVDAFEREFADFLAVKHVVGVGNGMDAIQLALAAIGVADGDEVLTTPNSAFATTLAILKLRAVPKFVDIDERTYGLDVQRLDAAIGPRTRAILPVHIYGQAMDLDTVDAIARSRGLTPVNDAAQAHGAHWNGRDIATYGAATAYSFYPTKNLGCLGDGGAVATNDSAIAARIRQARDYGQERRYVHIDAGGLNSRLDELQAAILRVKLRHLAAHNERRAAIARYYQDRLQLLPLALPTVTERSSSVHHLFVIRSARRDALMQHLRERHVATLVHYPLPIPFQPAMKAFSYRKGDFPIAERCANEFLSLPVHPDLTDDEVETVVAAVRAFFA